MSILPGHPSGERKSLIFSGICFFILGIFAITMPWATTVSTAELTGGLFVAAGLIGAIVARAFRGSESCLGKSLISLLTLGAGLFLVFRPVASMNIVMVLVTAVLVLDGALGLLVAYAVRPLSGWGMLSVFSIVTLIAGILVILGIPASVQILFGPLIGISFLMSGFESIQLARMTASTDTL